MKEKIIKNYKLALIFLAFVLITLLTVLKMDSYVSTDTPWHLKLGEWILNNKKVPDTDYFSVHNGLNFMAHEWLFDAIAAYINIHFGYKALMLIMFTVVCLVQTHLAVKSKAPVVAAAIVLLFNILGFGKIFAIIPNNIGVLILFYGIYNLLNYEIEKDFKKLLIKNIIITVLIANMHGGFLSLHLIFTIALTGVSFISKYKENKFSYIRQYISYILSTLLAGIINPYGIKIYTYAYKMLGCSASKYNSDFVPFSFNSILTIIVFVGTIALFLYGIRKETDKTKAYKYLLALCINVTLLLRYSRSTDLYLLCVITVLSPYILKAIENIIALIPKNKITKWGRRILIGLINVGLTLFIFIFGYISYVLIPNSVENRIHAERITKSMEQTMKQTTGTVYNMCHLGGYMIYLGIEPFVDGRIDPFVPEFDNPDIYEEWRCALYDSEKMDALVEKYNITYALIDFESAAIANFMYSDNWEVVDYSMTAVLFERK